MELDAYPFSERYGWLQDRYGLSWQLMFVDGREARQKIMPTLMFVGNVCGKAEEAIGFYVSVFRQREKKKVIYWHGDLPPLEAEPIGEHVVEATSARVKGDLAQRGALWEQSHDDLMARLQDRLQQEVARLGGDYAHILQESIDSQRDDAAGEAWLHGRLNYSLLRDPSKH
jgi:uncharacterized glyoxalase superfamily protein PhnB